MSKAPRLKAPKGDAPRVITKRHAKAKQWFIDNGISIAAWARQHGFQAGLVYEVLKGRSPVRGNSHKIAVMLGIKDGVIPGARK